MRENKRARQLVVLCTAVETGCYDSPPRTSTEKLARSFDPSRTTLEEHLRKAEAKVLRCVMGVLMSYPVLAQAARSGGRRFPSQSVGTFP